MFVLKYFKNTPRSPPHRATGPKCYFFFFKFETRSLEKKRGLSPTLGATGACRPLGGDRVPPPYISPGRHMPPFPLSFEPKNSGKKRGVRRKKCGEALPNCVLVIYR